ncbi:MAG: hypothetical protein ACRDSK_10070 [Actinophytocola sp.]|uniref:hypothetical protein n=1 Tax=Actinophytocola sp. TaxID=1872138 RepID=UPI003D6A9182
MTKPFPGLRRPRRYERIARIGGHPAPAGWPYDEAEVLTFEPTPVDRDAARRQVEQDVTPLFPHGVDEATAHAPERLIDERRNQWLASVDREHRKFLARATHRLGSAEAAVQQLTTVHKADEADVAELTKARGATFEALTTPGDGRGFDDAGLVGGRPVGAYRHVVALVIAALADIGAFAQVVQLIMTGQPALVAFTVVIGLTVVVLCLAHFSGVTFRERAARMPGRARWAWVSLVVWALIGLAAFWVRLSMEDSPSGVPAGDFTAGAAPEETATEDEQSLLPAALVFLALYLGSGVVALVGAYLTHNPLPGAHRALRRRHTRAADRLGASDAALAKVCALREAQQQAIDDADQALRDERTERTCLAEELKQYARMLMAYRAQDAAFTDAVFQPDPRSLPTAHTTNGSTEPDPTPTPDLRSSQ